MGIFSGVLRCGVVGLGRSGGRSMGRSMGTSMVGVGRNITQGISYSYSGP